jgi:Fic family protein
MSRSRFDSMSAQIRRERNDYYEILERTQKATIDVTSWMEWCLGCLGRAIDGAQMTLDRAEESALLAERARRVD